MWRLSAKLAAESRHWTHHANPEAQAGEAAAEVHGKGVAAFIYAAWGRQHNKHNAKFNYLEPEALNPKPSSSTKHYKPSRHTGLRVKGILVDG